jgi:ribosomal protein S18 acetylase RimI-like enzyme
MISLRYRHAFKGAPNGTFSTSHHVSHHKMSVSDPTKEVNIQGRTPGPMNDEVTVRIGSVSDAEALTCFVRSAFRDAFGDRCSPEDIDDFFSRALTPKVQAAEINSRDHTYFLAERRSELVGCAMLSKSDAPPGVSDGPSLEIHRVYGVGVGAALMDAAHKHAVALGYRTTWLGVWEGNSRAFGFYHRLGYERLSTEAPVFLLGGARWRMVLFRRFL